MEEETLIVTRKDLAGEHGDMPADDIRIRHLKSDVAYVKVIHSDVVVFVEGEYARLLKHRLLGVFSSREILTQDTTDKIAEYSDTGCESRQNG